MEKILVCSPTYNESENIKILCKKIFDINKNLHLLIIDDNSPDNTSGIVEDLKLRNKNLFLIKRKSKTGIGSAIMVGFDFALKKNYNAIITLDADLSHDPKDIPLFINKLKENDFVIGSRYIKGGKSDYKGIRDFLSRSANILCNFFLNMPFKEFTTSYRIYSNKCLKTLSKFKLSTEDYSSQIEFFFYIYYSGLKCCEIPIHFKDRSKGSSKIPKLQIIYSLFKLIKLYFLKKNLKLNKK